MEDMRDAYGPSSSNVIGLMLVPARGCMHLSGILRRDL